MYLANAFFALLVRSVKVDAALCNDTIILLAGIRFEGDMVEDADREAKDR